MLVLSRKPGEQIQIDGHITVTVLGVDGKRIRLGIDAPKEVPVLRGELKTALDSSDDRSSYQPTRRGSSHRMTAPGAVWEV